MKILAIIQARLTSTRFPNKVNELIHGKKMVDWVIDAAKSAKLVDEVVVAWAHEFPELDENNVLGRFRAIVPKEDHKIIVRLTSDCPLLTGDIIDEAIETFKANKKECFLNYYCNREKYEDGYDVQVFDSELLYRYPNFVNTEHVFNSSYVPNYYQHSWSVDTPEDLERVKNKMEASLALGH